MLKPFSYPYKYNRSTTRVLFTRRVKPTQKQYRNGGLQPKTPFRASRPPALWVGELYEAGPWCSRSTKPGTETGNWPMQQGNETAPKTTQSQTTTHSTLNIRRNLNSFSIFLLIYRFFTFKFFLFFLLPFTSIKQQTVSSF